MIALDTNLLLYAHHPTLPEHERAQHVIENAFMDDRGCGIAAASLAEFWNASTDPTGPLPSSILEEAAEFIYELTVGGGMHIWVPTPGFCQRLIRTAIKLNVWGVRIFDLQIALTALENGATEFWTHDKNFINIEGLLVKDPLA